MGELIAAGTPLGELPTTIERRCCPGKSCGNTTAKLHVDAEVVAGQVELSDSYRREDNGDYYFRPQRTLDDLIVLLNEPAFWPAPEVLDGWQAARMDSERSGQHGLLRHRRGDRRLRGSAR